MGVTHGVCSREAVTVTLGIQRCACSPARRGIPDPLTTNGDNP